jgi:hypothetical protein
MRRAPGLQEAPAGAGMDYSLKEVVAVGAIVAAAAQAAVLEQTLRAARAQVLAAELLDQVLVAVDGAQAALHRGFRGEAVAALATDGERRVRRGSDRVPYGLQGWWGGSRALPATRDEDDAGCGPRGGSRTHMGP